MIFILFTGTRKIPTLSLSNAPDKFEIRKINTEWSNEI